MPSRPMPILFVAATIRVKSLGGMLSRLRSLKCMLEEGLRVSYLLILEMKSDGGIGKRALMSRDAP